MFERRHLLCQLSDPLLVANLFGFELKFDFELKFEFELIVEDGNRHFEAQEVRSFKCGELTRTSFMTTFKKKKSLSTP